MPRSKDFQPVIGLEVHVELSTTSKMFCACPAAHFGKKPNTQVCPVCLGLPGALPVPNEKAIRWTQLLGAALGCELAKDTWFERKHYFYPDLPKGYQISQYERPLAVSGKWEVGSGRLDREVGSRKVVRIRRVHLEEDTGKLLHQVVGGKQVTLVDFNRSGVPLVEIVTEPDISSSQEAVEFVKGLQQVVRYLGISDADMEKGSMRLEANISLREKQRTESSRSIRRIGKQKLPDYRVELKNINSFRFMEAAINYEIKRQSELIVKGEKLEQETRGYDEKSGTTKPQRWKEFAQDYRYFPEPDIPPFSFDTKVLQKIKKEIPELPHEKRKRFRKEHGLSEQYVQVLTQTRNIADYFEEAVRTGEEHGVTAKKIADTIVNKKPDIEKIFPAKLVEMLRKAIKKPVYSDEELETAVVQSLEENPEAARDYRQGKHTAIQFLVGQVMRKTRGQADPQKTRELIEKKLR